MARGITKDTAELLKNIPLMPAPRSVHEHNAIYGVKRFIETHIARYPARVTWESDASAFDIARDFYVYVESLDEYALASLTFQFDPRAFDDSASRYAEWIKKIGTHELAETRRCERLRKEKEGPEIFS